MKFKNVLGVVVAAAFVFFVLGIMFAMNYPISGFKIAEVSPTVVFLSIQNTVLIISVIVTWYSSRKHMSAIEDKLWMSTFSNYTERYQDIITKIPIKSFSDSDQLSENELKANLSNFRAYFNLCSEEYYLNRIGKLRDIVWFTWDEEMRKCMRYPAFRKAWEHVKLITCYDDRFISLVESIMHERKKRETD
jgi:hypothetical protein